MSTKSSSQAPVVTGKWLTYLSILSSLTLVVFLLLLVLLPVGLKYGIIYGVKQLSGYDVTIGDVDLNLFKGKLSIDDLHMYQDDEHVITSKNVALQISVRSLWERRLLIESLDLSGMKLTFQEKRVLWNALMPLLEETHEEITDGGTEPWYFGLDTVRVDDVTLNASALGTVAVLHLDEVELTNLYSWQPEQAAQLVLLGALNGAALDIKADLKAFAEAKQFNTHIEMASLNLAFLAPFIKNDVDEFKASLQLNSDLNVTIDEAGGMMLHQKGQVIADIDSLMYQDVELDKSTLNWSGQVDIGVGQDSVPVELSGKLENNHLLLQLPALAWSVEHNGFAWQGSTEFDVVALEDTLQVSGALSVQKPVIKDLKGILSPMALTSLNVTGVDVQGMNQIAVEKMTFTGISLVTMEDVATAFSLNANLGVDVLTVADQSDIAIQKIVFSDLDSRVSILEDGQIEGLNAYLDAVKVRLADPNINEDKTVTEVAPAAIEKIQEPTAITWRIQEIVAENNNVIHFTDKGVTPPKAIPVTIDVFKIQALDSQQPDEKTPVHIATRVGKYTEVTLKGEATPLSEQLDGLFKLTIKGLDMTLFSAHATQRSGYQIDSGQLNLDSDFKFEAGKIHAENQLTLKHLDLDPVDKTLVANLTKQLTLPLGTALDLLENDEGVIKLSVPIDENAGGTAVGVRDVLRLATVQAIKKGSLKYLKYAVNPYGLVLFAGEQLGEQLLKVRFAPVRFQPGVTDIIEGDIAHLEKMVKGLKENKRHRKLSIKLCPVVTASDGDTEKKPILDQASRALAEARANKIKAILVDTHQLPHDRVMLCQASLGKGEPRVEIGL